MVVLGEVDVSITVVVVEDFGSDVVDVTVVDIIAEVVVVPSVGVLLELSIDVVEVVIGVVDFAIMIHR